MNLKLLQFLLKNYNTLILIFFANYSYSQNFNSDLIDFEDQNTNVELISAGSNWKYSDERTDQTENWKSISYNDSKWSDGKAELEFDDEGEVKKAKFGSSVKTRSITTYFRKKFNVPSISDVTGLELSLLNGVSAVVYLNGTEIHRNNLSLGNIAFNTIPELNIRGPDTDVSTYDIVEISSSSLLVGENIIAVEIHQQIATPSDLIFDLRLRALTIAYDPNTFAVIGDYGSNYSQEGSVASLVKSWNPGFVITTGDNNYPDGASSTIDRNIGKYYHDYIYPYKGAYGNGADINRFFPSLGNHDVITSSGGPYFQYFTLPNNERYYDFIKGNIHFFVINSNSSDPSGNSQSSTQASWLKNKLASSTSVWNIVFFHHSPYSSDAVHGSQAVMQWPFKTWGADLVLSGHSHDYERILKDNFTYIVNGLGGSSRYSFKSTSVSGSQVRYNSNFGAIKVTVTTDALYFRFYNISNTLIDTYKLPRPGSTSTSCVAKITPGGSTTFCAGGKVTLFADVVAGRFYQWKKDGVNIIGATSSSYTATQAGYYQLKISSTNCVDWSALTKVTINTSLVAKITPGGSTTFCSGGSVKLYANTCSGYIYQWKKNGSNISGATANYYIATSSGDYQVKIVSGSSAAWSSLVSVAVTSCATGASVLTAVDSVPLTIIPEDDNFKITVYPNPTTGLFTFEFCLDDIHEEELNVDVLNSIGQIVYSKHEAQVSGCVKKTIELENELSTGIYILRLTIGGKIENIRVMLSR